MNDDHDKTTPPASPQVLFDGLAQTSKQMIDSLVSSLASAPTTDSAELLRSLKIGRAHV